MALRLRYETGTATLVQLIVMLLLNFANAITTIITTCVHHDQCVENTVVTALYIIAMAVWLVFLTILGFAAQDRRSVFIARILLMAEALVAIVALFDIRHSPNALGFITSLVDFALAAWVIIPAYRLQKARGGRITERPRSRRRPTKPTE